MEPILLCRLLKTKQNNVLKEKNNLVHLVTNSGKNYEKHLKFLEK